MILQLKNLNEFVAYLNQYVTITEDEVAKLILPVIDIRTYSKKQLISKAGEVENNVYFIIDGIVRQYFVDISGQITNLLFGKNNFISNYASFFTRKPAEYNFEAIENTTAVVLNYAAFEKISNKDAKFEKLIRLILLDILIAKDKRQLNLVRQNPRERFLNFAKENPGFMQRVPQKYIASYLNIKPETFSRFKHLMKKS